MCINCAILVPLFQNAFYLTKIVYFFLQLFHHYSYTDAIPDFEAAIKLDNTVACFHVCLGLTYLLYSKQYQRYVTAVTFCLNITDKDYIKQSYLHVCIFVS